MARASMASLIATLRGSSNAGTADFVVGDTSYFSDDHLQSALDRYGVNLREAMLYPQSTKTAGGTIVYTDYTTPAKWLESTDSGGSAGFIVSDGLGNIQGTALWSADYENGQVTFGADQAGSARFVTTRSYDVYAAASDIWQQKAAAYATQIDFSTANHTVKRSHIVKQCQDMAAKYAGMATTGGASSADVDRGDRSGRYYEQEHDR